QIVSPSPPTPRSDFSRSYRLLLILAVFFLVVVFIFPIILSPGVEPQNSLSTGSSLSMTVRISNRNPFMPLKEVEYTCEAWKVILASGAEVTDASVLTRGSLQQIEGSNMITVPCETAYIVNAPIKMAEYRLTLTYRTYPWPDHRTSVFRIAALTDGNGRV